MKRKFQVTVKNGHGDQATVTVLVRSDRHPRQYSGPAILKARRILPDQKPWTVGPWEELPAQLPRLGAPPWELRLAREETQFRIDDNERRRERGLPTYEV